MRKKHQDYPWRVWFAERKFSLRRGTDFSVPCYVMAQQVRNKAKKLGMGRVSISIGETELSVEMNGGGA